MAMSSAEKKVSRGMCLHSILFYKTVCRHIPAKQKDTIVTILMSVQLNILIACNDKTINTSNI